MSRYFARLVQRAAGVAHMRQATPAPSLTPAGSVAHDDSFDAVAPLEPPPASHRTESAPAERPAPATLRRPIDPQTFPTPAATPVLQPAPAPVAAEAPVNPQLIQPRSAAAAEALAPERATQSLERPRPAEIVEHTRIEREVVRKLIPHASEKPLNPVSLPAAPSRIKPAPERSPDKLVNPVVVQLPESPVDRLAPQPPAMEKMLEKIAPELRHEHAPSPVPHPEPRLVIGRMQVEVVPSAPAPQTPLRVIHRVPTAPAASSAPSQIHFGLGQM